MRITVCIPATRAATLAAAIASVYRQTYSDWELVVVAQGPDSAVPAVAHSLFRDSDRGRVVTIARPGLSRARNAALQHARGEIMAMIDDDCEAAPDWLATIACCFDEDPNLGLVGGALVAPAPQGRLSRCPALDPADAVYDPAADCGPPPGWDWIGGNFAIQRRVADAVGPFDECLGAGADFPAGEDTDYKLRLEEHGVRMRSTPRAVVNHTSGSRVGLPAVLRFQRAYAVGNGALAAKLTLRHDPRGRDWLLRTRQQCVHALLDLRRAHRAPWSLMRWSQYRAAYGRCLRDYEADERGLLRPRISRSR